MEDEIKVGEWVRIFNGEIGKIIKIKNDDEYSYDYYICDNDRATSLKSMILRHSPNIIDLIEEGDYVNGKYVCSIGTAIGNLFIINHTDGTFTPSNLIESIVTKEQMAQMEYKVKEQKNDCYNNK